MARDVYSLRIFGDAGLVPAAGTVGPLVPPGLVYVLRDVDVYCDTAAIGDNLILFSPVMGVLYDWTFSSTTTVHDFAWRGRQVYAEGEQVGFRSFHGTWAVTASGYQLTTP